MIKYVHSFIFSAVLFLSHIEKGNALSRNLNQDSFLSLPYIECDSKSFGRYYSETELLSLLSARSDVRHLDLSGQCEMSEALFYLIGQQMQSLESLWLEGHVLFHKTRYGGWESILFMPITPLKLEQLFSSAVGLKALSLKMSSVDDDGLLALSSGATALEELDLSGCPNVTDQGLDYLVAFCPLLEKITLLPVFINKPCGHQKLIQPQVSLEKVEELRSLGIEVEWFPMESDQHGFCR
ncbi:MAG: hypothetical protein K0S07_20 [Chlamydiales bacterium]|jgi:hypothetical protein|nr:hypothetical protein [Chlamydiales bacterium]